MRSPPPISGIHRRFAKVICYCTLEEEESRHGEGSWTPLAAGPAKVTGGEDVGRSEEPLRESRKHTEFFGD